MIRINMLPKPKINGGLYVDMRKKYESFCSEISLNSLKTHFTNRDQSDGSMV